MILTAFGALAWCCMNSQLTTKTLRGRYQLTKNIFVTCYLDVLEANNNGIQAFIGVKNRGDSTVPLGSRIFFDADAINKINARRNQSYDIFSIVVQAVQEMNGRPLHVCTPILKENYADRRQVERKPSSFPVMVTDRRSDTDFIATDGNASGLTLRYTGRKAMLNLAIRETYTFIVDYKGKQYQLSGEVKHIQYDWKTHEHSMGVHFPKLTDDEELILNLLVDPSYTINVSGKQTVDTTAGKVSADD